MVYEIYLQNMVAPASRVAQVRPGQGPWAPHSAGHEGSYETPGDRTRRSWTNPGDLEIYPDRGYIK